MCSFAKISLVWMLPMYSVIDSSEFLVFSYGFKRSSLFDLLINFNLSSLIITFFPQILASCNAYYFFTITPRFAYFMVITFFHRSRNLQFLRVSFVCIYWRRKTINNKSVSIFLFILHWDVFKYKISLLSQYSLPNSFNSIQSVKFFSPKH